MELVVDTQRLPEVLDAICSYNFFTVTSMRLSAVDPFDDVQSGFFYGSAPVTKVSLTIETVWLREWTMQYMPPQIKEALGIGAPPTSAESSSEDF
jgi:hypothetical protein